MRTRRFESILAVVALLVIVIAAFLGFKREAGELRKNIVSIIPDNYKAVQIGEKQCIIYPEGSDIAEAYISIEQASGYGGEMNVAVFVDTTLHISNLKVIRHGETPSFLKKTEKKGLFDALRGKAYSDPFSASKDVDIISGATYTSNALVSCAKKGVRRIAEDEYNLEVPQDKELKFTFGIAEIALIVLYILAFIGVYTKFRYKKLLRWITMLGGLIILGFWFAVPLSLSRINIFLMGYWPDWHTELYWYILVFGFFLTLLTTRKDVYCSWICPLGCIQEGLGLIGGAKPRFSRRVNTILKWISRTLAWLAIVAALYFRNPVKINYEIFGVATSLTGATYLFAFTSVFLIAALFIKRPWCRYLCPILPISDFIRLLRIKKVSNNKNCHSETKNLKQQYGHNTR